LRITQTAFVFSASTQTGDMYGMIWLETFSDLYGKHFSLLRPT